MVKSPKKASDGFEEAPQAPFEGEPLSGSVSDWVKQLEREAEQQSRGESMREIRSRAGKHRKAVEKDARGMAETGMGEKRSSRGGTFSDSLREIQFHLKREQQRILTADGARHRVRDAFSIPSIELPTIHFIH